jgi:hypothetical protein
MTAREVVEASLLRILNRSLRFQGIYDVDVVGLSKDFKVAFVVFRSGERMLRGAVQAKILLSK